MGDALLRRIAERLSTCARDTDVVARLGGDEFAILASNVQQSVGINRLARRVLDAVRRPVAIEGHEIHPATCIGIAMFPHDGRTNAELLDHADQALYCAKRKGAGTYHYFDADLDAEAAKRRRLESELGRAVAHNELRLAFQPQVRFEDGAVIGFEALLRWQHPKRGLLAPSEFMDVATSSWLAHAITDRVLHASATLAQQWAAAGGVDVPLWINVTQRDLHRPGFFEVMVRLLEETGVPPRGLGLEVCENASTDLADVRETLDDLKALGLRLAIDNFGNGRCTLDYLRHLEIDQLKIAPRFVRSLLTDPSDRAVAAAIIALARGMNARTVAVGVESSAQVAVLRDLGCDHAQGYHYGAPMPVDELHRWLGEYRTRAV